MTTKGRKQTPEHVAKRQRYGAQHHSWKGPSVRVESGRMRAVRMYPHVGPCVECGKEKAERHHIDGNTTNNDPSNIAILCRRCHMKSDGRLEKVKAHLKEVQPIGRAASGEQRRIRAKNRPLESFNLSTRQGRYMARKRGHDVPKLKSGVPPKPRNDA